MFCLVVCSILNNIYKVTNICPLTDIQYKNHSTFGTCKSANFVSVVVIHIHPIQASSFGDFCIKFSTDKQDTTDGAGDEEVTNKNKDDGATTVDKINKY